MREVLLYGSFVIAVFGGLFGYLHATSEVIEVEVTGKRIAQAMWRPGVDSNDYVIETRKSGDLALSTLPFMGYFWGGGEAYEGLRVGGRYRLRIVTYPFVRAPDNIAVIAIIE
ncbi:MAG: hypothetical protein R3229_14795 [Alphaproteobacteria bacterium]|nr:hypothetical protein [Alphaproteobacteria bacterium]